jgi:hypothetical protein
MRLATAKPRQLKATAPTMMSRMKARAVLPVADHRDDQVGECGGDQAVGDDAGDVVHRFVDSPARDGDVLVLEHRPEDHQEQDREGECEEHALLVAVKAAQVGAELVDGQVPELVAGASGVAGVVADGGHWDSRVSCR